MAYLDEHKAKFDNLKAVLDVKNRTQLSLVANGGYSILFTYPPKEEGLYLDKARKELDKENFEIIDIKYDNLSQLSQVDAALLQNLKYCILRLQNNSNPIDLNLLNPLTNLEVIHIIIETDFIGSPSIINLINQSIIITYIISIPQ